MGVQLWAPPIPGPVQGPGQRTRLSPPVGGPAYSTGAPPVISDAPQGILFWNRAWFGAINTKVNYIHFLFCRKELYGPRYRIIQTHY